MELFWNKGVHTRAQSRIAIVVRFQAQPTPEIQEGGGHWASLPFTRCFVSAQGSAKSSSHTMEFPKRFHMQVGASSARGSCPEAPGNTTEARATLAGCCSAEFLVVLAQMILGDGGGLSLGVTIPLFPFQQLCLAACSGSACCLIWSPFPFRCCCWQTMELGSDLHAEPLTGGPDVQMGEKSLGTSRAGGLGNS